MSTYSYDRTSEAYSYDRVAAGGELDPKGFEEELRKHVKLDGRQLKFVPKSSMSDTLFINFYNLPQGVGGAGGGAEAENNRMMFMVEGFPKDGSPATKVKVEMRVSALPREHKLRAKSGPPAAIAKYLADFISKTVKEVEPKFTHTKMA